MVSERKGRLRGVAGFQASKENQELQKRASEARKKQAYKPMRFWLPEGNEAKIVILDESIDDLFFMSEHQFKNTNTGRWDGFEECVNEREDCPICDGRLTGETKNPYMALFLSIIDTTPYFNKKGEKVKFSRKLLCVKQPQSIGQALSACQKQNGTIKGCVINLKRGSDSPNIGELQINSSGMSFGFLTLEKMKKFFSHPAIPNKDGEVVVPEDGQMEMFNYDEIFPQNSEREICLRWGIKPPSSKSSDIVAQSVIDDDSGIGLEDSFDDGVGNNTGQSDNDSQPSRQRTRNAAVDNDSIDEKDDNDDFEFGDDDIPF